MEVVATLKEAAVDSAMAVGSVVVEVAWAAMMLVVEMCERAFDAIEQAMRGRAARSMARRIACFRGARSAIRLRGFVIVSTSRFWERVVFIQINRQPSSPQYYVCAE